MRLIHGLLLALVCLAGCATTRAVVADVALQCGVKVASAVAQTEQVLTTATSADAALAEIAQIVGAAASDASAVYCVISEAVKSLKARSTSGGVAPASSQLRAMALPGDPTAHGIALGEDLLRDQSRALVVSTVGAP